MSIEEQAMMAWNKYNPEWLINKVDANLKNDEEFIYSISELHEAYVSGFKAGFIYRLTDTIPEVGGR
jgi:hypothetical protein